MNETILVVDDEKKYRELISLFLRSEGLNVLEAPNGKIALQLFYSKKPDLIVLDVMLPDISGFDLCKKIRESSEVPILFLSALEDEGYHVIGYRAGADDYISKPFQSTVFALKVKRILQRTKQTEQPKEGKVTRMGSLTLHEDSYTCSVDGEEIPLTQKEFSVLFALIKNPGRVLTREYLLENVWGYDFAGETRAVDTMIKKLRKKLGAAAYLIKTVVSVGYKMEDSL